MCSDKIIIVFILFKNKQTLKLLACLGFLQTSSGWEDNLLHLDSCFLHLTQTSHVINAVDGIDEEKVLPVVQWNEVEVSDLDWRPKLKHKPKTIRELINNMTQYEVVKWKFISINLFI